MQPRTEHIHIRVSENEKAILYRAAQAEDVTVSQFVMRVSLPAAQEVLKREDGVIQTLFKLSAEEWDEFNRLLDAPTRDIPELRALLSASPPWEE